MRRIAHATGTVLLVLFSPAIIVLAALSRTVFPDEPEPRDEFGPPPGQDRQAPR